MWVVSRARRDFLDRLEHCEMRNTKVEVAFQEKRKNDKGRTDTQLEKPCCVVCSDTSAASCEVTGEVDVLEEEGLVGFVRLWGDWHDWTCHCLIDCVPYLKALGFMGS